MKNTSYEHKDTCRLDETSGTYQYDCSGLAAEFVLGKLLPQHRKVLCQDDQGRGECDDYIDCGDSGIAENYNRPLAGDFYDYFMNHGTSSEYWVMINNFAEVQPGDIIAVKYYDPNNQNNTTGHIMIAHSSPKKLVNKEYSLFVIDSAQSGHGQDSRQYASNNNGIGKGLMWFGVDANGKPIYYRWSGATNCKYCINDAADDVEGCAESEVCNSDKYLEGIAIGRAIGRED